jgi:hypothetical protein
LSEKVILVRRIFCVTELHKNAWSASLSQKSHSVIENRGDIQVFNPVRKTAWEERARNKNDVCLKCVFRKRTNLKVSLPASEQVNTVNHLSF